MVPDAEQDERRSRVVQQAEAPFIRIVFSMRAEASLRRSRPRPRTPVVMDSGAHSRSANAPGMTTRRRAARISTADMRAYHLANRRDIASIVRAKLWSDSDGNNARQPRSRHR